jgi:hypothetical protein
MRLWRYRLERPMRGYEAYEAWAMRYRLYGDEGYGKLLGLQEAYEAYMRL